MPRIRNSHHSSNSSVRLKDKVNFTMQPSQKPTAPFTGIEATKGQKSVNLNLKDMTPMGDKHMTKEQLRPAISMKNMATRKLNRDLKPNLGINNSHARKANTRKDIRTPMFEGEALKTEPNELPQEIYT